MPFELAPVGSVDLFAFALFCLLSGDSATADVEVDAFERIFHTLAHVCFQQLLAVFSFVLLGLLPFLPLRF